MLPRSTVTPLRARWDELVVVCGGTNWDGNRFPEHHVAEYLARHVPVLFVDPPLSVTAAARDPRLVPSYREPRLRLVAPSLARVTPIVPPGKDRPGLARLTDLRLRRTVSRAVAALGGEVRAVLSIMPHHDVFGAGDGDGDGALRVYYAADDYEAASELMGRSRSQLVRSEARIARRADVVVAASVEIAQKWQARGKRVLLMPNGCDPEHFRVADGAPRPHDLLLDPPVAGYVGHLSKRIDLRLLEAVADHGHSLLLVGPRQSTFELRTVDALLARPNVQWVGPKAFSELGPYLAAIDVGLVPYTTSRFNVASFPMKILEYLAAGRPVVSSDLPASRWLGTDLVGIADGPDSFAGLVAARLGTAGDPTTRARCRALAEQHTWARRVSDLADALGLCQASPLERSPSP